MEVWKIIFLSKWLISRFHVNLPGCNQEIPWVNGDPKGPRHPLVCVLRINLPYLHGWSMYMGLSLNGGFPQQPRVFLLKVIIFGV